VKPKRKNRVYGGSAKKRAEPLLRLWRPAKNQILTADLSEVEWLRAVRLGLFETVLWPREHRARPRLIYARLKPGMSLAAMRSAVLLSESADGEFIGTTPPTFDDNGLLVAIASVKGYELQWKRWQDRRQSRRKRR
jgi:hypothetical protein